MTKMTFEEFRATGKDCDDLGAALNDALWDGIEPGRGRLYLDVLYIERQPKAGWPNGRPEQWSLLLGNNDWLSDDLNLLEGKLYEFALDAEYIVDPDKCRHRDDGRGRCIDCGTFLDTWEDRDARA